MLLEKQLTRYSVGCSHERHRSSFQMFHHQRSDQGIIANEIDFLEPGRWVNHPVGIGYSQRGWNGSGAGGFWRFWRVGVHRLFAHDNPRFLVLPQTPEYGMPDVPA